MFAFLRVLPKFSKITHQPIKACFSASYGKKTNELYREEGKHTSENLPLEKDHYQLSYLERNEVEARIMKILSYFEKVNLKSFKWTDSFEKDLKMDSLDQTILLTSVETEFNIVFEDRVFDNLKNLEEVIRYILGDSMVI